MSLTNEQIVDAIAEKSLMEVMELVKAIEEKFGVSAAAMAAPAAGGGAAALGWATPNASAAACSGPSKRAAST